MSQPYGPPRPVTGRALHFFSLRVKIEKVQFLLLLGGYNLKTLYLFRAQKF
jgi:hypothetical protein